MRTVSIRLADLDRGSIPVGFAGENLHTQVRIDCKKAYEEYPAAVVGLIVKNPNGDAYPAVTVRDGDIVTWDVTNADLAYEGTGEIQLTFTVGEVVKKSYIGRIRIDKSILNPGETPDPIKNWIDQANEILEEVEDAVPEGGTTGQVLAKKSDSDRDTEWVDPGSGGTTDYDQLENRPQIAGVTLTGDVSLHDLGAAAESDIPDVSGFYTKPSGGIPDTDLASGVQTSLGKADTAYQLPSGGIPADDIASGVIPDPTSIIDDTAGDGDTDKVWSADKSHSLLTEINTVRPDATDSDVGKYLKVKTVADGKVSEYEFGSGGGGGGGTDDYSDLDNKPQINSVTLSGNKTLTEIGAASEKVLTLDARGGSVNVVNGYEAKYWSNISTLNNVSGTSHTDIDVQGVGGTLTYKVLNVSPIPLGFIMYDLDGTKYEELKNTTGEHSFNISGAVKIKLNIYGNYLESGFTITYNPLAPQYRLDYLQEEIRNGYEVVEWGDSKGYVGNNGSVNAYNPYSYKTISDPSKYTRIEYNLASSTSLGCVVIKHSDNSYTYTTGAAGNNVVEVPKNASVIYLNFYNQSYRGKYHLYTKLNVTEKYPLKVLVAKGEEDKYIDRYGVAQSGFRHTTLDRPKLVKAIRFTSLTSTSAPSVVWKKDNGWSYFATYLLSTPRDNYVLIDGADEVYVNWFGAEYCTSFEVFYEPYDEEGLSTIGPTLTDVLDKPYNFNGKTALFFGDSITVGYTTINGTQQVTTENFVKKFCNAVGMTYTNAAQGGACMYDRQGQTQDIPVQITNATLNTDFVFIAGGTNDQASDITLTQFESALDDICTYLQANYTGKVIFITPIGRLHFNKHPYNINEYRRLITKYAILNGYDVVDGSKFNFPEIYGDLYDYLISDETHPTLAGYEHYAKMLRTVLC